MQAVDIMTGNVLTVTPETSVRDVAKLFAEQRISGAPVVDAAGELVGMISEGDLLRRAELGTDKQRPRSWFELFSASDEAREYVKSHGLSVADVMTREVVKVDEETPISEIATLLEKRRIKRVPVTRAGKLVGIVSRANLIQALASLPEEPVDDANSPVSDSEIRARLMGEIAGRAWAFAGRNLVVTDGVVHLWGVFHSLEAVEAVRVAAQSIPGVKGVEDHTEPYPMMPGI